MRDLVGHSDSVTACAVTADGRSVVSASYDRTLMVWDLESGRALATLKGHSPFRLNASSDISASYFVLPTRRAFAHAPPAVFAAISQPRDLLDHARRGVIRVRSERCADLLLYYCRPEGYSRPSLIHFLLTILYLRDST